MCAFICSAIKVYESSKRMDEIPKWFPGSRLNFAENLLKFQDDRIALISVGEGDRLVKYTYKQLYVQVEKCAAALRQHGVTQGDRIVAYIPNCPEAVRWFLALISKDDCDAFGCEYWRDLVVGFSRFWSDGAWKRFLSFHSLTRVF